MAARRGVAAIEPVHPRPRVDQQIALVVEHPDVEGERLVVGDVVHLVGLGAQHQPQDVHVGADRLQILGDDEHLGLRHLHDVFKSSAL